jgi:hypothetical protein
MIEIIISMIKYITSHENEKISKWNWKNYMHILWNESFQICNIYIYDWLHNVITFNLSCWII